MINQAMYTGVTGLNTNGENMGIVANNIANANTRAFKTDRGEFEDLFISGMNDKGAFGRGSRMRGVTTDFKQGVLTTTGGVTDLGIQGDGFFVVRNASNEGQESGGQMFTRQGSFRFDKDGYLSDLSGGKVQGYMVDQDGFMLPTLTDIQVVSGSLPPAATTVATANVNLDPRERPPFREFDINEPAKTSNYSTTVTLYDSMGRSHLTTIYFSRTPESDKNEWNWHATVSSKDLQDGEIRNSKGEVIDAIIGQGKVEFDSEGNPIMKHLTKDGKPIFFDVMEKSDAFEVQFKDGARAQQIQFNFGPAMHEGGQLSNQSSTSIASKSTTMFHTQNGYEGGSLKSLKIDLDGSVRGAYTNGLERKLANVAMATFPNNQGLAKAGQNSYMQTPKSGNARIGAPQTGTRGSVYSANLEESNVDLASQFVNMITTQRGFQANSKSVTTADSMLEEIINLKR